MTITINLNDIAHFKLTDFGKGLWLAYWNNEQWAHDKITDGVLREQLWSAMQIFGPYLRMGTKNPFDLNIEIER